MATLLESYKGRIALSEKFYAQKNAGAKMDAERKMNLAKVLANTSKFMNESFASNMMPTQIGDMGQFKKFCLDITTLTAPNMIVNDLFMVKPISSITGYITYMEFALGTEKGGVGADTVIQNPFYYNAMTEDRMNYSGERVVEAAAAGVFAPAWAPVKGDVVIAIKADGTEVEVAKDSEGKFVLPAGTAKVKYIYDNQIIPQAKLPTLVGRMKSIPVAARARRIAINYSQFAAFVSKNDYGIDFESTIAQQAQAELQYETDQEAVFLIKDAADKAAAAGKIAAIEWIDEELDTISYAMKAEGFARKLEQAKMDVYKRTGRHIPNWMLVNPEMMPILNFVPGFKAAGGAIANGPYVAGEINGVKVIVTPSLLAGAGEKGVCYLGVLANDGVTAVGGYFPYMPLVPTQLLGFADGTMQQGFSSLYDMQILNDGLLGKIVVKEGDNAALYHEI